MSKRPNGELCLLISMQILFKVTLFIFRSSTAHVKEKFLNCNFIQIATKRYGVTILSGKKAVNLK